MIRQDLLEKESIRYHERMPFRRSILAIITVLIAHGVGVLGMYWIYRWFDIPVHFLGGFAAGILALDIKGYVVAELKTRYISSKLFVLIYVLGVTALVGVGWELHEYALDQIRNTEVILQPDLADTMLDFTMDLCGGLFAYVISRRK